MRIIRYPPLAEYEARYAGLEKRPLRVTVEMEPGAHLAQYDPPNLDNLLAWCVVQEATQGAGLPHEAQDCYRLPLPLAVLWRSDADLPLYAATPLLPEGVAFADVCYLHKRSQSGRWTAGKRGKFSVDITKGRWMERRIPQKTVLAEQFEAACVGNAEEIARLLTQAGHVGKRRHSGFGAVRRWRIVPGEFALLRERRLSRSLPLAAHPALLPDEPFPEGAPGPLGWTCPQWKSSLWLPGWPVGTPVQ